MEQKNWRQNFTRLLHALVNFVEVQLNTSLGQLITEAVFIAVAIWFLHSIAAHMKGL